MVYTFKVLTSDQELSECLHTNVFCAFSHFGRAKRVYISFNRMYKPTVPMAANGKNSDRWWGFRQWPPMEPRGPLTVGA